MNSQSPNSSSPQVTVVPLATAVLEQEVAILAGRLAHLLRQRFAENMAAVEMALGFLDARYREYCGEHALAHWQGGMAARLRQQPQAPLQRLATALALPQELLELIVFAGLAEEHEGFADIFSSLHPSGQPLPSIGLAAQLLAPTAQQRLLLRGLLEANDARELGLFVIDEEVPFYNRSLRLAEHLWSVFKGIDAWPRNIQQSAAPAVAAGLHSWLQQEDCQQALQLLRSGQPLSLVLSAHSARLATERALLLLDSAGLRGVTLHNIAELDQRGQSLAQLHCLARSVIPLLPLAGKGGARAGDLSQQRPLYFQRYPGPIVVCAEYGSGRAPDNRALLSLRIEALQAPDLRGMWRELLPELAADADLLAARYPLEPTLARTIAMDLQQRFAGSGAPIELHSLANAIRARSSSNLGGAVQLIRPQADWSQLVLPSVQLKQLQDACNRLLLQSTVLDDWQFLRGRRGARGVRMLFVGPSGTGKTLSAEVLANALDVDLLQVDLSQVVSKWIGETEKNLAEVFNTAESGRAVLFFDEADSLFGKRTEVSDANDRYANLETAYLLSRLERYEGLAILATNFRQNIDTAFTRRLEFIVEFTEPGFAERLRLWQCHIPAAAPLAGDVAKEELAELFPIVGGHIRNAAVAAAFLAARDKTPIARQHFIEAIRREYEKSGKAYREITPY